MKPFKYYFDFLYLNFYFLQIFKEKKKKLLAFSIHKGNLDIKL